MWSIQLEQGLLSSLKHNQTMKKKPKLKPKLRPMKRKKYKLVVELELELGHYKWVVDWCRRAVAVVVVVVVVEQ